jgi:hypothetical protein
MNETEQAANAERERCVKICQDLIDQLEAAKHDHTCKTVRIITAEMIKHRILQHEN